MTVLPIKNFYAMKSDIFVWILIELMTECYKKMVKSINKPLKAVENFDNNHIVVVGGRIEFRISSPSMASNDCHCVWLS
jgi:hypothetical protein